MMNINRKKKQIKLKQRIPKEEKISNNSKKGLLKQLNEKHPEWKLGKGRGISIAALKEALKSDKQPVAKKRTNPYFTFLAITREELSSQQLTQKQIIRVGSRRWQIVKYFAATEGHNEKDIVESPKLLKEVATICNY